MKLEALFDAVIVKPVEDEETMYGSIVVPDAGKDRNEKGVIVAVGPGKATVTGTFLETTVKEGDTVILPTMGFSKLEHDGEEYFIGPENQILARVKKTINPEEVSSIMKDMEETDNIPF